MNLQRNATVFQHVLKQTSPQNVTHINFFNIK